MAISFAVSEYVDLGRAPAERVPVVSLPPLKSKRYTAAGRTDPFQNEARNFRLRNLGDPLWFRVVLLTDGAAAGDTPTSEWIETGDVIDFMLPHLATSQLWQLDVRAR